MINWLKSREVSCILSFRLCEIWSMKPWLDWTGVKVSLYSFLKIFTGNLSNKGENRGNKICSNALSEVLVVFQSIISKLQLSVSPHWSQKEFFSLQGCQLSTIYVLQMYHTHTNTAFTNFGTTAQKNKNFIFALISWYFQYGMFIKEIPIFREHR